MKVEKFNKPYYLLDLKGYEWDEGQKTTQDKKKSLPDEGILGAPNIILDFIVHGSNEEILSLLRVC